MHLHEVTRLMAIQIEPSLLDSIFNFKTVLTISSAASQITANIPSGEEALLLQLVLIHAVMLSTTSISNTIGARTEGSKRS